MKNRVVSGVVILLTGLTIGLGIYNWINNADFFKITSAQILTLFVTLGVAFYAAQYKNDERKGKENAEKVLIKLQNLVSSEQFYSIPSTGDLEQIQKEINTTNRRINNCIDVLKKYGEKFHFKNEIEYISNEFDKYKTQIGDHINDLDYLSKTEKEFRRISDNIDSKCDYIIVSLF